MNAEFSAKLASVNSKYKARMAREAAKKHYLQSRLREIFREIVREFESTFGEKPDTVFTTPYILRCLAHNQHEIIVIDDLDNKQKQYYQGIHIVPSQINVIVAALCSDNKTIKAYKKQVNDYDYDIIKDIDEEYQAISTENT